MWIRQCLCQRYGVIPYGWRHFWLFDLTYSIYGEFSLTWLATSHANLLDIGTKQSVYKKSSTPSGLRLRVSRLGFRAVIFPREKEKEKWPKNKNFPSKFSFASRTTDSTHDWFGIACIVGGLLVGWGTGPHRAWSTKTSCEAAGVPPRSSRHHRSRPCSRALHQLYRQQRRLQNLGHQHSRRLLLCRGHQYGCRDVMWKPSIPYCTRLSVDHFMRSSVDKNAPNHKLARTERHAVIND